MVICFGAERSCRGLPPPRRLWWQTSEEIIPNFSLLLVASSVLLKDILEKRSNLVGVTSILMLGHVFGVEVLVRRGEEKGFSF